MVAVSDESLAEGNEATLNIMAARTGKLDRVCNSSLAVEANSAVAAVAAGEWVIMLYGEFSNARFDPQLFKRRLRAWDQTTAVEPSPGYKFRGTLVMRDSTEEALRAALLIVDAKSLYDSIRKTARGK